MDEREMFLSEVRMKLTNKVSAETIIIVNAALILALEKFNVGKKSESLAVIDSKNESIIKTYTACLYVDGKAERTIEFYAKSLRKFSDFLDGKHFTDVGPFDIRLYLGKIMERGCSKQTAENNRALLSAFYTWLVSEEMISKNPMANIKPVKVDYVEREPFSDVEIDAMRGACTGLRERAIFEFLMASGVRVSELCNLNRDDVNIPQKTVHVRCGKGGKDRTTYLNDVAACYLQKYLDKRDDSREELFLSYRGGRYSVNGVESMIKKIGNKAGVNNAHPHRFRRTCATKLAKQIGVESVSKILGHTALDTTMRYVKISDVRIKSEYQRAVI